MGQNFDPNRSKEFSLGKNFLSIPSEVGKWLGECQKAPRKVEYLIRNNQLFKKRSRNCWYQCTVKGGREGRDVDAMQLAQVCEKLGAGEILLNCIDKDGTNSGFDIELVKHISEGVSIPVIASSGAGKVEHFSEVFEKTDVETALAAGILLREEDPH